MEATRAKGGWGSSSACLSRVFWITLALAFSTFATLAQGQIGPEQACKNAMSVDSPRCMNGGTLFFENLDETHATSCAHCNCPAGWTGSDCSRK